MDRDDTILDYLQGRLSSEERQRFEHALSQDTSLSGEVDVMRAVRAELAARPAQHNSEAVWDRLSTNIDALSRPANQNQRPWGQVLRYAAVAFVAIATWQLAVAPRFDGTHDGFQTASEQSAHFVLQVKFIQSTTIGEIGTVLMSSEGMITNGPSALGLFHISFPDQISLELALNTLQSRSDIVELVTKQ